MCERERVCVRFLGCFHGAIRLRHRVGGAPRAPPAPRPRSAGACAQARVINWRARPGLPRAGARTPRPLHAHRAASTRIAARTVANALKEWMRKRAISMLIAWSVLITSYFNVLIVRYRRCDRAISVLIARQWCWSRYIGAARWTSLLITRYPCL